jgi:hypothetical protein
MFNLIETMYMGSWFHLTSLSPKMVEIMLQDDISTHNYHDLMDNVYNGYMS